MQLSTKLEKLRKKKGFSQEELANKVGVSRQSVFKWESGENTPDIEKIKKLASIYNVSFDVLLNDEMEIDDDFEIQTPSKAKKPFNKKLFFISLSAVLGVAVITTSSILIVKGVQHSQEVERYNNQIQNVVNLIDNLGEITLESEPKIIEAENAYQALTNEQKAKVTNYDKLVEARETYEELAFNDREEKTKDDPSRTIVLSDLNGEWKSKYDTWKIANVAGKQSVLYWTSEDPNGSVISSNLKDSYVIGYNNKTMRMEISLYHYYSFGEEFLDVSMTKSEEDKLSLYYQDRIYTKIA